MAIKQTSLVSFFNGRGDKMHEDDENESGESQSAREKKWFWNPPHLEMQLHWLHCFLWLPVLQRPRSHLPSEINLFDDMSAEKSVWEAHSVSGVQYNLMNQQTWITKQYCSSINPDDFHEDMVCYMPGQNNTTAAEILKALNDYMTGKLDWPCLHPPKDAPACEWTHWGPS